MNLYNNKLRKIEKQRELLLEKEQKELQPWKVDKKSRKIISEKFPNKKPLYERTLDLAEKRRRELEYLARVNEIEKENEMKKLKTRWNSGKLDRETFDDFIEKQKLWEKHKNTKVMLLREEYDEIEKKAIEETMFKPQLNINKKAKSITKRNENINSKKVHERLYEYNEELKNKKANLGKKNIPTFVPIINKKIPKYIKNKNKKNINDWENQENRDIYLNNYSNISNNLNENEYPENVINANYINNLDDYTNIEKIDLKTNFYNEKNIDKHYSRDLEKNNIDNLMKVNRKNSAPIQRSDSDLSFSIKQMLKPKFEKKDFDLNTKGLKTDFNNINAGNNLKNLLNENKNQKNEEIILNKNNSQKEIFKNMSSGNIKRRLSDKLPIERFSIPINNIKVNQNLGNKNYNSKENEIKSLKKINTIIPDDTYINKKTLNMNINNVQNNLNDCFDNDNKTIMLEDKNVQKLNLKKRLSTSLVEENRGINYILKSLNNENNNISQLYFKGLNGEDKSNVFNQQGSLGINNHNQNINFNENRSNLKKKF